MPNTAIPDTGCPPTQADVKPDSGLEARCDGWLGNGEDQTGGEMASQCTKLQQSSSHVLESDVSQTKTAGTHMSTTLSSALSLSFLAGRTSHGHQTASSVHSITSTMPTEGVDDEQLTTAADRSTQHAVNTMKTANEPYPVEV